MNLLQNPEDNIPKGTPPSDHKLYLPLINDKYFIKRMLADA